MNTLQSAARPTDAAPPRDRAAAGVGTAVLVRAATLAQLLAAALFLAVDDYHVVAVALGVSAAAQVFTDSGAAAYLSVVDSSQESLGDEVRHLVTLQVAVGCLAATLSAFLILRIEDSGDLWVVLGLLAIPTTSAVESVGRVCRVLWLRDGLHLHYAAPDAAYCAARLVPVACLAAGMGTPAFIPGLALAVVVTLVVWSRTARRVQRESQQSPTGRRTSFRTTAGRSLSYGLPVVAAGLYSQAPVVITSAMSSLETAAAVAVATRLVQPLEMVAASYSQISLPRLSRSQMPRRGFLGTIAVQGLVLCAVGLLGASLFLHLSGAEADVWALTFLLLAVLPLKYLNYGLATVLMGLRRPLVRTLVSVTLGLICVVTIVGVSDLPVIWIGSVVAINEVLLALGLAAAIRIVEHHGARVHG